MRPARFSAHRVVAVISGAAWVWSWYTMYLEVHRWKQLTKSFRFNPGPPIPGTTIRPRPGLPLKALLVCAAGSPAVFAAGGSRPWPAPAPALGRRGAGIVLRLAATEDAPCVAPINGFVSGTAES